MPPRIIDHHPQLAPTRPLHLPCQRRKAQAARPAPVVRNEVRLPLLPLGMVCRQRRRRGDVDSEGGV